MNPPTLPEYIKPNTFVKLRDGSKARIYAVDGPSPYHVHGAIYQDNYWLQREWCGQYYTIDIGHSRDIIGPWIDKPNCDKLWPLLPPWIKYLAQDYDGNWYASFDKPELKERYWTACSGKFIVIPKDYAPIYSGDWKDSLVERPH